MKPFTLQHNAYNLQLPACWQAPLALSIPHSGRQYPQSLREKNSPPMQILRKLEDSYVDQLFNGCVETGIPLLCAKYARAYIDLNRDEREIDPLLCLSPVPHTSLATARVASGLGLIPRLAGEGVPIYREKLSLEEFTHRTATIYHPYHRQLTQLLAKLQADWQFSLLIDCHSMPAQALPSHYSTQPAADIVLGTRYGSSCAEEITRCFEQLFHHHGLKTLRNKPYAGGYITQNYGKPTSNSHAIQIEINRSLYMNETTYIKTANFIPLQQILTKIMTVFTGELRQNFTPHEHAAEAAE